jgi:hypothetical protein
VQPDLEQAEKLGILVMTREDLDDGVTRTMLIPNADQLLEQAQETVRAAQAKYESDALLSIPPTPLDD